MGRTKLLRAKRVVEFQAPGQMSLLFFLFLLIFQHSFDLVDSFGDQYRPWTRFGAFKMIVAGPYTIRLIENIEALFKTHITRVREKTKPLSNCSWSQEIWVFFNYRAG